MNLTIPQQIYNAIQEVETDPKDLINWKFDIWEVQYGIDTRLQKLFSNVSQDVKNNFYDTILANPYIPHVPFYQQVAYNLSFDEELLYGGASGGGKSDAILMDSLQYVDFPDFASLIIRRTYTDLALEGALMDRAHNWLDNTDARWRDIKKRWEFPSGATLSFRYMDNERDVKRIQGTDYHIISVDELTQLPQKWWQFLSRSIRRDAGDPIPLKKRGASNPGDIGHEWVKERFIVGNCKFIPSTWKDNPFIDQVSYSRSLDNLDDITRLQLKFGDWEAVPEGKLFRREWFTQNGYTSVEEDVLFVLRFWDLAATLEVDPNKRGGADWTVGVLLIKGVSGRVYLEDIIRFRLDPDEAEDNIIKTCLADAKQYGRDEYKVRIEQEGGASAKYVIHNFSKRLAGLDFDGSHIPRRSKIDRARAFVGFIKHGNFKVRDGSLWLNEFLNEVASFPTKGVHDDQVDALSGGLNELLDMNLPLNVNHFAMIGF